MKESLFVRKLQQKDNHTFIIEWGNGQVHECRLSLLQKNCPCAGCVDEMTGLRRLDAKQLDDNVRAVRIANVGRYALKIDFTSGCSTGIFTFDMLYHLLHQSHALEDS